MTPRSLARSLCGLWAVSSWMTPVPLQARADERHEPAPPAVEGALDNDVFVPIDERAQAALARGDQALARVRGLSATAPASEGERFLDEAFDAWREALGSEAHANVWHALGPGAEQRLAEGIPWAVARRLAGLSSTERARFVARLEPAAVAALAAARAEAPPSERETRLAECVRRFPLSPGAARAALTLGDLALERGQHARALAWYARAAASGASSADDDLGRALAARRGASAQPSGTVAEELWRDATGVSFVAAVAWNEAGRDAPGKGSGVERRPRPGGAFVDERRFVVQTRSEVLVLALDDPHGLALESRVRMDDCLDACPDLAFDAPREPPGWPLLPLCAGSRIVLVVGRTRGDEPNALLALDLDAPDPFRGVGLDLGRGAKGARFAWSVSGTERVGARGLEPEPVPALEELGNYEFQPGPVLSADAVIVQARRFEERVTAWLLAFDLRDGGLLWKRALASGADRVALGRFFQSAPRVAGQPLCAFEVEGSPRVFVGTHLGLGVLVDSLLGEPVWSFKNRRRPESESGWSGDRPPLATSPGAPVVLWAPMDSDRLYALRTGPATQAAKDEDAVLVQPSVPRVDAETLLGGDALEHVVLGTTGRERTLSARRAGADRLDALDLGRDERFRGLGLLSARRAWAVSNRGLYVFDRERELYLADYADLTPAGSDVPGGDLYARGSAVLVVGSSAVWRFQAR